MVALVTGAGGFLGGYIADRLREGGWDVTGAGRPEIEIPSRPFAELLKTRRPSVLVHCAAPASVGASIEDPARDLQGSVDVLSGVLEHARALRKPPRILLLSSAAVYGEAQVLPIAETHSTAPVSPYGFHRLASEVLLREYSAVYGVPTAALRIFSAYGEGLRRQILWDICRMGVRNGRVELQGTGRESRDFVHASDVAEAAVAVIGAGQFEAEAYNVGSGVETTIADLARMAVVGVGLPEESVSFSGSARPGDPANWRADISRLSSLGVEPRVSIEQGVAAYAGWAADRLNAPEDRG